MGFELKQWRVMGVAIVVMVIYSKFPECAQGFPEVPCYFIFGDSLADNGNNNYLQTLAKVDYSPYGIDFPHGPSGRFTNGRTVVDFMAELLGFHHYIPPYANVDFVDILFGVNYASGSAGIRNESGQHLGERIPFDMQLENHQTVVSYLAKIFGTKESASWYLSKCLYTVGLGNNDYINNYFLPDYYNTSQQYSLQQFTQLVIQQYTHQIKRLHSYGARKVAIFGLGSLGCTPKAISKYGTNGSSCVETIEEASILFNSMLIRLVDQLNHNFTDAIFTYINYYSIGEGSYVLGFTNATSGCCAVRGDGQCLRNEIPCTNRTSYVFWDAFHPTEVFNEYVAGRAYKASESSDSYPFDIRSLFMLNQQVETA